MAKLYGCSKAVILKYAKDIGYTNTIAETYILQGKNIYLSVLTTQLNKTIQIK